MRQLEDETILVVANLSRYVQYVELDLGKWKGMRPVELFGHTEFPPIGELPYLLTLGGHDFLLVLDRAATVDDGCRSGRRLPTAHDRLRQRREPPLRRGPGRAGGRPPRVSRHPTLVRRPRLSNQRHPDRGGCRAGGRVPAHRAGRVRRSRSRRVRDPAGSRRRSRRGRWGTPAPAAGDGRLAEAAERRRHPGRRDGGRRRRARDPDRHRRQAARHRPPRRRRGDPLRRARRARRRADQHQRRARRRRDPLRRSLPAEDVPSPRSGGEPRARDPARHRGPRPGAGPCRGGRDRIPAARRRARHAGGAAGVRPQRGDGLDPRARGASPLLRAGADPPPSGSTSRTDASPAARAGTGGDAPRGRARRSAPTSIWRR